MQIDKRALKYFESIVTFSKALIFSLFTAHWVQMAPPSYKEAWELESCHVPEDRKLQIFWWSAVMTNIINKQINEAGRSMAEYENEVSDKVWTTAWNCVFACVCVMCVCYVYFFTKWLIIHSRKILSLPTICHAIIEVCWRTKQAKIHLLFVIGDSSEGYMVYKLDQSLFMAKSGCYW